MSPPTHSWANGASGARACVGRVAVAATALPSVDLGWGADLVAELSQAFLGVGVVVVRLLQLGRIDFHHPGGLQVQCADHLDHDLQVLVERAVSAVWAWRAVGRHDRLERRGLGLERARRVEQVGHHDLEPVAATTAPDEHYCLRSRASMSLACQRHVPGSASGSSTTLSTPALPMMA